MERSTFSRGALALLVCTTALVLAAEPAPAQAQAGAEQAADGWIAQTVRQVAPAVVMVEAGPSSTGFPGFQMPDQRTMDDFLRRFGDEVPRGLQLPRFDGKTGSRTGHDATLVGSDPESGIAVLRIEANAPLPVLDWGGEGAIEIGTEVTAIGRGEAFGTTAWTGRVAAIDPAGERLLIDDPLGPSAIGAPLIGADGRVAGIAGVGGEVDADASIAISAAAARDVVDELSSEGAISRGYLGVQIQPVTQDLAEALGLDTAEGALVTSLQPGAPAEAAGIREGDVILSLDGKEVADPADLSRRVSDLEPGQTVQLVLWRENERTALDVELAGAPGTDAVPIESAGTELSELGLTVTEVTPEVRDRFAIPETVSGVAVLDVGEDVPPEALIEEGDVIVGVQRQQVGSVPDLQRAIEQVQAEDRSAALLLVQRGETRRFVAVPVQ